ncbi:MAG TPA: hypothetical protein VHB68_15005 [Steroidobacteraceae bacterium]|nr:hypothetical protein [Steroidobacteraceae bacterium]
MKTTAAALVMGFAAAGSLMAQPQQAQAPMSTDPSLTVTHPTANPQPTVNPQLAGESAASREREQLHMALAGTIAPGMQVKSPAGDVLGTVASIVPGDTGVKGYVVVASSGGLATPVPYNTASALVQHDALVIDKARLESAPKVQQYQSEDGSSQTWQKKADNYWKKYEVHLD